MRDIFLNNSKLSLLYTCPECSPIIELNTPVETFINTLQPFKQPISQPNCRNHINNISNLFCVTCDKAICEGCKDNSHPSHTILSHSEYYERVTKLKPTKYTFDRLSTEFLTNIT